MNDMLDKIKCLIDSLINAHLKLGIKTIIMYILLFLGVYGVLNFKSCVVTAVELFMDISNDIHQDRMLLRDQYVSELSPMLTEFRSEMGADRILYFEYHNSEQNLDNLPFKFFDLILCNSKYGVSHVLGESYKNINASMYINFFNEINKGHILINEGLSDEKFDKEYSIHRLFMEKDHSVKHVIFSVPGTIQPIGFIVLEWLDDDKPVNINPEKIHEFLPRINAVSVSLSKK